MRTPAVPVRSSRLRAAIGVGLCVTLGAAGCGEETEATDAGVEADVALDVQDDAEADAATDAGDAAADVVADAEPDAQADATEDVPDDVADVAPDVAADTTPDVYVPPEPTDEARAAAFQLFYRERVDRALVAYNRFGMFGDVGFAVANRASVSREGDTYDVVVGPRDNNLIGTPMRAVWHAWKHLGSRAAELTLFRMFNGMLFYEQVTGHPGVTSRMALTGWTLDIDGTDDTWTRTRGGEVVESPLVVDAEIEQEILDTFFDGVQMRYRMDPTDTMLTWYPGWNPVDYAITISIPELPDFIRISDCCATLMHTPEGNDWAGSWWSNHNSRDNYPDIALGILAAHEAIASEDADPALQALAERVVEAGLRIADHVEANGGTVMTVDEYNGYDTLVPSGVIRPHGLTESEALGGMSSCPMALLNRSLSTDGLDAEPENVLLPGTPELLITPDLERLLSCPYDTPRVCSGIEDAWCGYTWETVFDLQFSGQSWLDFARNMERFEAGSSETLLGAFQNDYDDVVEAMTTLIGVLEVQGETEQAVRARTTLGHMTRLMREFADIIYTVADPEQRTEQRYEAAVFDGLGGIEVNTGDLNGFAIEEERMQRLESLLDFAPATPRTLYTDAELLEMVTTGLAELEDKSGPGRSDAIRARYAAVYPDGQPPIRRAGDAYEARQGDGEWVAAELPTHRGVPGLDLMEGIVLCSTAPHLLDCSWARLGCAAPDLDDSGTVDAADAGLLDSAIAVIGLGAECVEGLCGPADLDQSGVLDASDVAFMAAAQGCVR